MKIFPTNNRLNFNAENIINCEQNLVLDGSLINQSSIIFYLPTHEELHTVILLI